MGGTPRWVSLGSRMEGWSGEMRIFFEFRAKFKFPESGWESVSASNASVLFRFAGIYVGVMRGVFLNQGGQ